MNNKIDYELEASHILEEHNIEEASASMVRSVDTNKGITYKHNMLMLHYCTLRSESIMLKLSCYLLLMTI